MTFVSNVAEEKSFISPADKTGACRRATKHPHSNDSLGARMLICMVACVILKDKTGPFYCGSCVDVRGRSRRGWDRSTEQSRQNRNKPELRTQSPHELAFIKDVSQQRRLYRCQRLNPAVLCCRGQTHIPLPL